MARRTTGHVAVPTRWAVPRMCRSGSEPRDPGSEPRDPGSSTGEELAALITASALAARDWLRARR